MTLKQMIAFAFLAAPLFLTAQKTVGLKGGFTRAWQNYGPAVELPDNAEVEVSGVNFSLMYYRKLAGRFTIGVEPGYIQRGAACEPGFFFPEIPDANVGDISDSFDGDTKLFLDYVELPLMVSLNIPIANDKMALIGKTGYGFSYLISAKREVIELGNDNGQMDKLSFGKSSRMNRVDHGAYGALCISYKLSDLHILAEVTHYRAIIHAERFNFSRNRSASFNLGVYWSL